MLEHGRQLVELFGEGVGVRQMRKWTAWYTKGFHGSASVRGKLMRINSLEDLAQTVSGLDMAEPFPVTALRAQRAKGSKTQSVKLPEGYLDDLEDDTPPKGRGRSRRSVLGEGPQRGMSASRTVVIVGAGAAGLWCAERLARACGPGTEVLVLEKTPRTGTKILASGGTLQRDDDAGAGRGGAAVREEG